ncbi:MAG: TonB-dependent receptor plug domain-containing protein [Cyclobacteriaceae bacterium]|nr:TonB-dependent receptor plug domain-containing protein [Cyclobacteriaceae bacterium]
MTRLAVVLLVLLLQISWRSPAQTGEAANRVLDTVSIEAYAAEQPLRNVAASIGSIDKKNFDRFNGTSLLPAFNMVPGIRMEERSPGSYRFSVRGSLLRSPFGVRNVKFYWNGLPFTDGGGNTYLNLLDLQAVSKAEIIKGPAGSLYGAGTGGAVLLRSAPVQQSAVALHALGGSFGTARIGGLVEAHSQSIGSRVQFTHQESDGFREQSAMKRNAFQADMMFPIDASDVLDVTVLYTDLTYQTPGGLTEAQYLADPRQARPRSGSIPSAAEQQAAVFNQTLFTGIHYEHQWSPSWSSTLGIVASSTEFKNPAIRNYETRDEQNVGARLTTTWAKNQDNLRTRIVFGGEYQQYRAPITVTDNVGGTPGSQIFSQDKITSLLALGFAQAEIHYAHGLQFVGGLSVNYVELNDERTAPSPGVTYKRSLNPVLLPRLAILKKLGTSVSVFASASRGFSPPTVAEVMPSTGIYNSALNPESGWSYEAGVHGNVGQRIEWHAALYDFRLDNAIVLQRDSMGADYYVNAGNTRQPGIEVAASWSKPYTGALQLLRLETGITYSAYKFGTYVNDGNDYSGNSLTGVPPWTVALGLDADFVHGFYTRITANYADRIPLNDANTDYASDYLLLGGRIGRRFTGRVPIDFFIGVDNALDQSYSLGNDLNAAGKRYFNAAPRINYYLGLSARLGFDAK